MDRTIAEERRGAADPVQPSNHNAIESKLLGSIAWVDLFSLIREVGFKILKPSHSYSGDIVGQGAFSEVYRYQVQEDDGVHFAQLNPPGPGLPGTVLAFKRVLRKFSFRDETQHAESKTWLKDEVQAMKVITNEIEALSRPSLRSHPNIVRLFQLELEDRGEGVMLWPTLVMEYCPCNLSQLLGEKTSDLELLERLEIVGGIERGVEAIHREFILHGDIKPGNILCGEKNGHIIPKIADFGSAKFLSAGRSVSISGTPPWMAPECYDLSNDGIQANVAISTDLYSFGLVAWAVFLNGRPMFGMLKQDLEEFKRMYRQQNGVWPELADLDDHYLRLVEDKVRSTDLGDLASAQVREAERGAEDEAIERICQLLSAVLRVNPGERLRQYGLLRSRLGQEWLQLDHHGLVLIPAGILPMDLFFGRLDYSLNQDIRQDKLNKLDPNTKKRIFSEYLDLVQIWVAEHHCGEHSERNESCQSCILELQCAVCGTMTPMDNGQAIADGSLAREQVLSLVTFDSQQAGLSQNSTDTLPQSRVCTCERLCKQPLVGTKELLSLPSGSFTFRNSIAHACMLSLAACYVDGFGVQEDLGAALHWLCKSALSGHHPSKVEAARLFFKIHSDQVPQYFPIPATKWLVQAAILLRSKPAEATLIRVWGVGAAVGLEGAKNALRIQQIHSVLALAGLPADFERIDPPDRLRGILDAAFGRLAELALYPGMPLQNHLLFWIASLTDLEERFEANQSLMPLMRSLILHRHLVTPFAWDCENPMRLTPLSLAASEGNSGALALLLDLGADPNKADSLRGYTPLHWACVSPAPSSCARVLLARPNGAMESLGRTTQHQWSLLSGLSNPYHIAGDTYLATVGTPLHWAVARSDEALVETLLTFGADPNAPNALEKTPLDVAAASRQPRVLGKLLGRTQTEIVSPLHLPLGDGSKYLRFVGGWSLEEEYDTHEILLNHSDSRFASSLSADGARRCFELWVFHAISEFRVEMMESLLRHLDERFRRLQIEQYSGPLCPAIWRDSPLGSFVHFAIRRQNVDVLKLVLESGADVSNKLQHASCLHTLARQRCTGLEQCLELLLNADADLGWQDEKGRTPLQTAVLAGNTRMADAMLRHLSPAEISSMLGRDSLAPSFTVSGERRMGQKKQYSMLGQLIHNRELAQGRMAGLEWLFKHDPVGEWTDFLNVCVERVDDSDTTDTSRRHNPFQLAVDGLGFQSRSLWSAGEDDRVVELDFQKFEPVYTLRVLLDQFQPETPELIQDRGSRDVTALHIAVFNGHFEAVELLVKVNSQNGAINARDTHPGRNRLTPLDFAFLGVPWLFDAKILPPTKEMCIRFMKARNEIAMLLRRNGAKMAEELDDAEGSYKENNFAWELPYMVSESLPDEYGPLSESGFKKRLKRRKKFCQAPFRPEMTIANVTLKALGGDVER